MQSGQDPIAEKVKKLFALSSSPNQAEAESALAKAHELLLRYNLSMEDVDNSVRPVIEERVYLCGRNAKPWRMILLSALCQANYCRFILSDRSRGRYAFLIVGRRCNTVTVAHMADYLFKVVDRLVRDNARSHYCQSYRLGVCTAIIRKIEAQMSQDLEAADARALVLVEQEDVKEHMKNMKTETLAIKGPTEIGAYHRGLVDGRTVSLDRQITA